MKKKIILYFLIFYVFFAHSQESQRKFKKISGNKNLSESVIFSIYQGKMGFLWLGTQNGLCKYDGYNFTFYKTYKKKENSISGNSVICIFEDSENKMWIGTENNGLNYFDRKKEKFHHFKKNQNKKNNISSNSILSIEEDNNGIIWIGTRNGLNYFDKDKKKFSKLTDIKAKSIRDIFIDEEENFWLATEKGLIFLNKEKNLKKNYNSTEDTSSISNNIVNKIFPINEEKLLITTNIGFNIFNKKTEKFERHYYDFNNYRDSIKSEIVDVIKDLYGNFWMASFGGGLIKWNIEKNYKEVFNFQQNKDNLLSKNHISSLFLDKSGLIWIGTYGDGLSKLEIEETKFQKTEHLKDEKNSLISNEVYAIFQDHEDNIWYGTEKGISIFYEKDKRYININTKNNKNLKDNSIYSFLLDDEKNIIVATASGLNKIKFKNGIAEIENLEIDEEAYFLFQDNKKNIWIAGNGLSIFDKKNQKLKFFEDNEILSQQINYIFQSKNEDIFVATEKGLLVFDKNQEIKDLNIISEINKKFQNAIYCIYEDKNGFIWCGTEGAGILKIDLKNSNVTNYTKKDGISDNVIYGIIEDDENNLWLSTNNGISIIKYSNRKDEIHFKNFNTKNGLHTKSFNIGAFHKNKNGLVFFGSNKGVLFFNPKNIKINNFIPPVFITDFELFFEKVEISDNEETPLNEHINYTNNLVLNHKQNNILFRFSALSFYKNEKNQFAYKMEGIDEEWIYVKNKREASYRPLGHGTYKFLLKASNSDGIWNEKGTYIDIFVSPPWYLRTCAIILEVLFFIFLIWLMYNMRIKGMQRMQKILEVKVIERTKEVMEQKHKVILQSEILNQANEELNTSNEELNATLENLKKTQSQLVSSEKMASLGQLTAGVAHEINNPINFISGNISPLKKDIGDLLEIIKEYEIIIEEQDLQENFEEIEELKEDLDYEYLLEEIKNLLNGMEVGTKRTTEIVRGLQNFSRLDEDDMKLININEGIESTLLILKNQIKNRIEIVKTLGEIPDIYCYPGKINQVFMNILTNAIQAINGKGEIFIKTKTKENYVFISIKDTGIGMSQSVKERIFEPFFTTKDIGKGTGLGLSISFGIVENHKGKIIVNSEVGKGTEFLIKLPIK